MAGFSTNIASSEAEQGPSEVSPEASQVGSQRETQKVNILIFTYFKLPFTVLGGGVYLLKNTIVSLFRKQL